MNIRCGKYVHLQSDYQKRKNSCYVGIRIEFSQPEYKKWCWQNQIVIESCNRPSIDRIDPSKNYTLDNLQVVELKTNVGRKRTKNKWSTSTKKRGVRKSGNRFSARITINSKETHLGLFDTIEEAYQVFYDFYLEHYNRPPWQDTLNEKNIHFGQEQRAEAVH